MQIVDEFDYRNAKAVLEAASPGYLSILRTILDDPGRQLDFELGRKKQRNLSQQIKPWFIEHGWKAEQPAYSVPGMLYDLLKDNIPIEIEIGHERLVFPDFFEFLADYSNGHIPVAVMIVTGTPNAFGHNWHCSLRSTRRKIESIQNVYLVPTLVIAIDP